MMFELEKLKVRNWEADDARGMYEKLQCHPNAQVSKRARQFSFGFQFWMLLTAGHGNDESQKVNPQKHGLRFIGSISKHFVEDKVDYTPASTETEEGDLVQALPYTIFLASPILLVLLIAATKRILLSII
ncbi:hypothetical protein Ancab_034714 [Ancistrocladus abbreviatus]